MTFLFIQIEKFLQTTLALSSRTIGIIRNALLLMWLYPLIKILPPRFPKNYSNINIMK